jgi:DNA invertase Pin-like site-specific DNA recombinase
MRRKITNEMWEQIKTAYASGIGLREIARNMDIPEGTVLARANREGWTREIQNAKALAKREDAPRTVTPVQAVAMSIGQRGGAPR